MTDGIIQKICKRKCKEIDSWFTELAIEELQQELIAEIKKEAFPTIEFEDNILLLKQLIGDNEK